MMKKKVLVVEDDKFFRFAIKKYINWDQYGFEITGEAVHGAAALEFLEKNTADIVITDMSMPIMNGAELTAELKKRYPSIVIIALSAYDDFDFVKESLKAGASDYILKQNIEKEDIAKTISEIWQSHVSAYWESDAVRDRVLHFLQGEAPDAETVRYLKLAMEDAGAAVLCMVSGLKDGWDSENCRRAKWLPESLVELKEGKRHILLVPLGDSHSMKQQLEERGKILSVLSGMLSGESCLAGCSRIIYDIDQLPSCYQETEQLLEIGRFADRERILVWDEQAIPDRIPDFYQPEESYQDITGPEQAREALKALTQKLREAMPDGPVLVRNYLACLKAVGRNLKYEKDDPDLTQVKERLQEAVRLDDMHRAACEYLEEIFEMREEPGLHGSIADSIQYIHKHYTENLTLAEIAEHAAMSESYLSSLFKKETGTGITGYLNALRIEKAKDLLRDTNLKNYEVGSRVGFPNASYFSTIFKKETGQTIQEFRRRYQKKVNKIQKN